MQSRSRLKKNQETQTQEQTVLPVEKSHRSGNNNRVTQYIRHIPLLVFSLFFLFWCIQIVTTKQPQDIANLVINQAYLQLLLPFFCFVTFFAGYLTLNMKRGSCIGLLATVLLLFRLQRIEVTFFWLLFYIALCVVCIRATKKQATQK